MILLKSKLQQVFSSLHLALIDDIAANHSAFVVCPTGLGLRAWRQRAQGAGATSIVLLLLAAAVHGTTYQATETAIEDTESLLRSMLHRQTSRV